MNYPDGPTDKAQVDSTEYDALLLGENDLGSVHLHGPFGDIDSDVKVAYLIGMHPLESKSHRALFERLISKDDRITVIIFTTLTSLTSPPKAKDVTKASFLQRNS
jgi:hypothetical protein